MMIELDNATNVPEEASLSEVSVAPGWTTNLETKYGEELDRWAEGARAVLAKAAEEEGKLSYREFFNRTSDVLSGAKPPLMWRRWVSFVLEEVALLDERNAEPLLTSLVVLTTDDEVNEAGYSRAVEVRYGFSPVEPAVHASIERDKCYRYFQAGADAAQIYDEMQKEKKAKAAAAAKAAKAKVATPRKKPATKAAKKAATANTTKAAVAKATKKAVAPRATKRASKKAV